MDKWIAFVVVGVVVGMFSPVIVMEQRKGQCQIEAIKAKMPADDIITLCGK